MSWEILCGFDIPSVAREPYGRDGLWVEIFWPRRHANQIQKRPKSEANVFPVIGMCKGSPIVTMYSGCKLR